MRRKEVLNRYSQCSRKERVVDSGVSLGAAEMFEQVDGPRPATRPWFWKLLPAPDSPTEVFPQLVYTAVAREMSSFLKTAEAHRTVSL